METEIIMPSEEPLPLEVEISVMPAKHMLLNLPSLALACNRTGVSNRSAAIIASAVLQDVGIISPDDNSFVVDCSKFGARESRCNLS